MRNSNCAGEIKSIFIVIGDLKAYGPAVSIIELADSTGLQSGPGPKVSGGLGKVILPALRLGMISYCAKLSSQGRLKDTGQIVLLRGRANQYPYLSPI